MSGLTVKKILVPTDFSEGSSAALQYAIGLARICSARLVLLHVMELAVYAVDFAMTHPGVPADIRRKLSEDPGCLRAIELLRRFEPLEAAAKAQNAGAGAEGAAGGDPVAAPGNGR